MKLLVDKLPQTKEECIFCVLSNEPYHRCIFELSAYDLGNGCSFYFHNCALTRGKECPYLKEANL